MSALTVGVEGPALAGKSSTIRALVPELERALGVTVACTSCFVEWSGANGLDLPALVPDSWTEQEEAVRFFLSADDARRAEAAPADLLMLDRTAWTLLAHTRALTELSLLPPGYSLEVLQEAIEARSPDVLIYLDTDQEDLEARRSSRPGFPDLLVDAGFNRIFRDAVLGECPEAIVVDGSQPLDAVVAAASSQLIAHVRASARSI